MAVNRSLRLNAINLDSARQILLFSGLVLVIVASLGTIDKLMTLAGLGGASFWLLMGVSAMMISIGWDASLISVLIQHRAVILLLVLALLSALWSFDPLITIRETLAIGYLLILSSIVTRCLSWQMCFSAFVVASCLSLGASVLIAFTNPLLAFHFDPFHYGHLQGVFHHKNQLALVALSGAICGLHLTRWEWVNGIWQRKTLAIASSGFCIAMLIFSDALSAKIGLAVCILFTLAGLSVASLGSKSIVSALTFSVLVIPFLTVGILLTDPTALQTVLGNKADSLLARRDAWLLALPQNPVRWISGYGLGVFWQPEFPSTLEVYESLNWKIANMHNGFLELILALGLPGLILFFVHLIKIVKALSQQLLNPQNYLSVAILSILAVIMIYNVSQSSLFGVFRTHWLLYLIVATLVLGRDTAHA